MVVVEVVVGVEVVVEVVVEVEVVVGVVVEVEVVVGVVTINEHPQGWAALDAQVHGSQSITSTLLDIEALSAVGVPDLTTVISPDINALATLLALLRKAVKELQDAAMWVEDEIVKQMPGKQVEVPGLGVIEMHTGASRKAWDKDGLVDVLVHSIERSVPDVLTPDGEFVNTMDLTRNIIGQFMQAATPSWKVTGLRQHGIDPGDYCETSWGRKTIQTPALPTATDEGVAAAVEAD